MSGYLVADQFSFFFSMDSVDNKKILEYHQTYYLKAMLHHIPDCYIYCINAGIIFENEHIRFVD